MKCELTPAPLSSSANEGLAAHATVSISLDIASSLNTQLVMGGDQTIPRGDIQYISNTVSWKIQSVCRRKGEYSWHQYLIMVSIAKPRLCSVNGLSAEFRRRGSDGHPTDLLHAFCILYCIRICSTPSPVHPVRVHPVRHLYST
jgi:hypothetical protein